MDLYAVELRTMDWRRLVAWYRGVLGLRVLVRVEDDRYALLAAGPARIAIVETRREEMATVVVGPDRLIFEVDDFEAAVGRIERSTGQQAAVRREAEGFVQCAATDPDGRSVRVIAWPPRLS
ncbi:MAG TPA: VOC family protein [Pirellulales bacterium]|jgi:predicted enzyme related to lactoylglutathione lyase|nr:VOC family protein [Pirellulales bacterium]